MSNNKLSVLQFVERAIPALRKDGYRGIHTVFSGFNSAFRLYFPDKDPVIEINKLVQAGKIDAHPVKGGVMLYLKGEMPPRNHNNSTAERTLRVILG